jgi:hypothetical protein
MSNNSTRRIDPSVVAALIGVIGTIVVTLITVFANRPSSSPQQIVITNTPAPAETVPTEPGAAGEPTSLPEPATQTPEPTFTVTPVPAIAIGEDWPQGCISTLWKPYPVTIPVLDKGNGCWQEPIQVFSASDGTLSFIYERSKTGSPEVYGLFAPLPEDGSVTFTVQAKDLTKVDLLMGVFAEPDIESQGLVIAIPYGNVKSTRILQKDNMTDYRMLQGTVPLEQKNGFSITFTFNAGSVGSTVNPTILTMYPVALPTAEKWLFFGYKSYDAAYRVEGNILNLQLK